MLVCAVGFDVIFSSLIYVELLFADDIDIIVLDGNELIMDIARQYISDAVNGVANRCSTTEFAGTTQSQSVLTIRAHWL